MEPVANQNSLSFYNRLFLVPKPNNWWRPILDLSTLNTFLNTEFRQDKYFLTFLPFCEFLGSGLVRSSNMQRTSKDKPRSVKCRHFCLPFDSHNYCPSCREASKGDDPCVTLESLCEICASFSDEQMNKIKNRKHYVRKQKADTSRDNELDLLGDEDVDSFTGSQADLEGAAAQLFVSHPHLQPLRFESLLSHSSSKICATNPRYCLTAENGI